MYIRLLFSGSRMSQFEMSQDELPALETNLVAKTYTVPAYFAAGVSRAAQAGRITLVNGALYLDGSPYTVPAFRPEVSYGQALTAIANASTIADLRTMLRYLADMCLEMGAIEL